MGCNTSKENQGTGEAAENENQKENQTGTEAAENHSNGKYGLMYLLKDFRRIQRAFHLYLFRIYLKIFSRQCRHFALFPALWSRKGRKVDLEFFYRTTFEILLFS